MRAVKIVSFGGVEGLEVVEVPDAAPPTADRVRVRVRAAGLNRADILQRLGRYPAPPGYSPDIPGLEFAGEIESVGEDAGRWKLGDRVFGITGGGGQAEYVTVPESTLARIPDNLEWAQAAAIPEVFMTAHDALFTQCGLQMDERVLIHAAGSGVGTAASQLVKAAGAVAYGTSRTAEKLERARDYGLSESVAAGNEPAKRRPRFFVKRPLRLRIRVYPIRRKAAMGSKEMQNAEYRMQNQRLTFCIRYSAFCIF